MAVGLVLSGGAPVLTFMAGALVALDERNVKFDVISTSGAGMLVGLLYAAPAGGAGKRREALKNTVSMGVSDEIYDRFPVNFKVFYKPGLLADVYRQWLRLFTPLRFADPRVQRCVTTCRHLPSPPSARAVSTRAASGCAPMRPGSKRLSISSA
jgi:predicted acylesterase/phospholipase RssA